MGVMAQRKTLVLRLAFGLSVTTAPQTAPLTAQSPAPGATARDVTPLPQAVAAPVDNPTTPEKVALGKQLFFDPRLSGDNSTSCATCHMPAKAFTDGLPRAKGARGKELSFL